MSGHSKWSEVRRQGNPALEQGFGAAIGASIKLPQLRAAAGLSQEELARRLGVTQSWVSQMEHETDLRVSTLSAYIAALGGCLRLGASFPDGRDVDLTDAPHEAHAAV